MNNSNDSVIVKCSGCGSANRVSVKTLSTKKAVCGRCQSPLPPVPAQPLIITDRNFQETVGKSDLPVLLDLWAAWCGPCRTIAPVIEQLASELAGRVLVGKLNVDENKATAATFRVQGIPTLLILQNGREAERIVGVESKESILRRLQKYL